MNTELEPHYSAASPDAREIIRATLVKHDADLYGLGTPSYARFSLARVLRAQANRQPLDARDKPVLEGAASFLAQQYDPYRAWVPFAAIETRAMTSIPGAKGGFLVGENTLEPVDVLRPWSVVASAGVQLLPGLRDGVLLPRVTASTTATWVGELSTPAGETPPSLGNVSITPKTAIAFVKFSAQLLRQGEAAEPFLRAQLLAAVGEVFDQAFFAGTGGVQPLGLLNTSGFGVQSGTSLAHAGILAMRKKVLAAGAREAALQWVGHQDVQELLGARERATGGGRFLWDDDGVLGKPAHATKTAAANTLVAGDFSQAVAGIFGPGIRLDVDPSQDFNSAGLVARVMLMCDVAFPQPAAFAVATGIT